MQPKAGVISTLAFALAHWPVMTAQAQEPDWSNIMNFDHAGFADSASVMAKGRFQIESGLEFTSDTTSTSWLGRFGLFDWAELRFEAPSLVATYEEPAIYNVDAVEAGIKAKLYESESILLSVLPYLILPAGSPISVSQLASPAVSVMADFSLINNIGLSLGIYSRLLGLKDFVSEDETYQLDSSFSGSFSWSVTRQLGLIFDAWYTFSDLTGDSAADPVPGADFAVYYLFTPNVVLDLYWGANCKTEQSESFGGFGVSVRF